MAGHLMMLLLQSAAGLSGSGTAPIIAQGWTGAGTASSPLMGPDTSDVTFSVNSSGYSFYVSAQTGDGSVSQPWTIERNGSVVASGTGTQINTNFAVSAGDTVRIYAAVAFNGGNLQVWLA